MKRIIGFVLVFVFMFAVAPALPAGAADEFVIEDGVLVEYNGKGGDVVIPDGVTKIAISAFRDNSDVTSITIPAGVKDIGDIVAGNMFALIHRVFMGCPNLTAINVSLNNSKFSSIDGVLFNKNGTTLIQYPSGNKRTSYDIPRSVTFIKDYAFFQSANLTSITMPYGLERIGYASFEHCHGLTDVIIPSSVVRIGGWAFTKCNNLTSVVIGKGVVEIHGNAFMDSRNLKNVYFISPTPPEYVYERAFWAVHPDAKAIVPQGATGYGAAGSDWHGLTVAFERFTSDPTTPNIGDPIGDVLHTDIVAYVNGHAIPSHNVKSITYIGVEDLTKYGFNVAWNSADKTLKITGFDPNKTVNPISVPKSSVPVGTFKTNYVYTEVKTYVGNKLVEGLNINGQTLIRFDALEAYGKLTWDGAKKELRLVTG